ncbi:MAG: hypothetical protein AB7V58_03445 [Solirubrobacterales bacterium]
MSATPETLADPGQAPAAGAASEPASAPATGRGARLVPWLVLGGAALTLAVGLGAKLADIHWGAPAQPFTLRWAPDLSAWALPGLAALLGCLLLAGPLLRARPRPLAFAAAAFALTLVSRLGLNVIRGGPDALSAVFDPNGGEGRTEYLPGLAYLRDGVGSFLDRFDQVVAVAPTHVAGHPPGLVLAIHALGIDTAAGLTALTIGVGALTTPALYALARQLADETTARAAALLFVFVPTSLLYGATSADALFATLAIAAAALLVARRPLLRGLGAALLALASFFSYALLAVGAWAALVLWRRRGIVAALRLCLLCAAALAALYLGLYLATGFDVLAAIGATDARYREGIASARPYLFYFFGSPAAFLLLLGPVAWFAARSLARREAAALALAAVIAISVIGGYTKAETERIWLFLVPLACLAAARALPARRLSPVLVALTVQAVAIQTLLFTKW